MFVSPLWCKNVCHPIVVKMFTPLWCKRVSSTPPFLYVKNNCNTLTGPKTNEVLYIFKWDHQILKALRSFWNWSSQKAKPNLQMFLITGPFKFNPAKIPLNNVFSIFYVLHVTQLMLWKLLIPPVCDYYYLEDKAWLMWCKGLWCDILCLPSTLYIHIV